MGKAYTFVPSLSLTHIVIVIWIYIERERSVSEPDSTAFSTIAKTTT